MSNQPEVVDIEHSHLSSPLYQRALHKIFHEKLSMAMTKGEFDSRVATNLMLTKEELKLQIGDWRCPDGERCIWTIYMNSD